MAEWVNAKERFPQEGEKVQVWVGGSRGVVTMYQRHAVWYKAGSGLTFGTVMARPYWRPLPEPPEENSND